MSSVKSFFVEIFFDLNSNLFYILYLKIIEKLKHRLIQTTIFKNLCVIISLVSKTQEDYG